MILFFSFGFLGFLASRQCHALMSKKNPTPKALLKMKMLPMNNLPLPEKTLLLFDDGKVLNEGSSQKLSLRNFSQTDFHKKAAQLSLNKKSTQKFSQEFKKIKKEKNLQIDHGSAYIFAYYFDDKLIAIESNNSIEIAPDTLEKDRKIIFELVGLFNQAQ